MDSVQVQGHIAGPEGPNDQIEQETVQDDFQVPEKFLSPDGQVDIRSLVNSYTELERAHSQPTQQQATDPASNGVMTPDDYASIMSAIDTSGDLSAEQYEAFASKGLSQDFMESFVKGQKAFMAQTRAEVYGSVGGERAYNEMIEWAAENLTADEVSAYDAAMMSGDMGQIKLHMQGLHARFTQATNRPRMLAGNVSQSNAAGAFQSWAQVTQAMKDPRYQADPAYRKTIEQRLAVTKNLQ